MTTILRVLGALIERDWAGRTIRRLSFAMDICAAFIYFAGVYYVGRLIASGDASVRSLLGGDWFTVTVIGIGLYGFFSAISAGPRTFLNGEINMGSMETLMTLGPSVMDFVQAATLQRAGRALGRMVLILTVALWFGVDVHAARLPMLLPVILLTAGAALGLGYLYAALDLRFRSAGRLATFAGGAGSILTGVYFPTALLPAVLKPLAQLLPATHAIAAARAALVRGEWAGDSLLVLGLYAVLLPILGLLVLSLSIRSMKRDGSFATY